MAKHLMQCVQCASLALEITDHSITCQQCKTIYNIFHDVPVLFADVMTQTVHQAPSEEFASWLADTMFLANNRETIVKLQAIFSTTYYFGEFSLDAENQFLDRLQNCGIEISREGFESNNQPKTSNLLDKLYEQIKQTVLRKVQALLTEIPSSTISAITDLSSLRPRYRWLLDYLPRVMSTETTFTGNVRLENIGAVPISSHSAIPTMISYHWRTANGELAVFDGHRTPLPIELLTGRQITVPMKLETPKEPGDYFLELTMVQEGECWLDENAEQIPIKVTAEPLPDLTIGWNISNEPASSYGEDHKKSINLLHARLQETGKSRFTLLEVGGNVHPTLFHFNGDLYNVDIDIHSMQIGAMLNKHWSKEVNFICADATALPFPDGMFDAIILCSALHHFPDVRKLLRSLSRKLRPCGFIATLSEPIGHYYGTNISSDLLRELSKGINEQTFTLEEYANIFQAAGLKAEVIADQGSLKAFLTLPQ